MAQIFISEFAWVPIGCRWAGLGDVFSRPKRFCFFVVPSCGCSHQADLPGSGFVGCFCEPSPFHGFGILCLPRPLSASLSWVRNILPTLSLGCVLWAGLACRIPEPAWLFLLDVNWPLVDCGVVFHCLVIVWVFFCMVGVSLFVGHSSLLDNPMVALGNHRFLKFVFCGV